jgi:hypothetical protein
MTKKMMMNPPEAINDFLSLFSKKEKAPNRATV